MTYPRCSTGRLADTSCGDCPCAAPRPAVVAGQLVLATQVEHTAKALRSLALRNGRGLVQLAHGLLSLEGANLQAFVTAAHAALSSVEAEEVRCLLLERDDLTGAALLGRAMSAPTLAQAGSRVAHADLVPLFARPGGGQKPSVMGNVRHLLCQRHAATCTGAVSGHPAPHSREDTGAAEPRSRGIGRSVSRGPCGTAGHRT